MSKPTHHIIYKARSYQAQDGTTKHAYPHILAAMSCSSLPTASA